MRLDCSVLMIVAGVWLWPLGAHSVAEAHPCPHETPPIVGGTRCNVEIEGVPSSQLDSIEVHVDGQRIQTHGTLSVAFDLGKPSAELEVATRRFHASQTVTAERCGRGIVGVRVEPRPATVRFEGVVRDTVVVCRKGCSADRIGVNVLVRRFAPIALGKESSRTLSLRFLHPQFESLDATVVVYAGENRLPVQMKARCP